MKDFQHHIIKKIIENHKENDFLENSSIEQQVLALEDKKKNLVAEHTESNYIL